MQDDIAENQNYVEIMPDEKGLLIRDWHRFYAEIQRLRTALTTAQAAEAEMRERAATWHDTQAAIYSALAKNEVAPSIIRELQEVMRSHREAAAIIRALPLSTKGRK